MCSFSQEKILLAKPAHNFQKVGCLQMEGDQRERSGDKLKKQTKIKFYLVFASLVQLAPILTPSGLVSGLF